MALLHCLLSHGGDLAEVPQKPANLEHVYLSTQDFALMSVFLISCYLSSFAATVTSYSFCLLRSPRYKKYQI